jgi:Ca2+-binding RTX toxin-like protein
VLARFFASAIPRIARLARGTLSVAGTGGPDPISVSRAAADQLAVTLNGVSQQFPLSDVRRIVINGRGGDDGITVASDIAIPSVLLGGAGADALTGGGGPDRLLGGGGDDRFVSRDSAHDLLLGGDGDDTAEADDADTPRGIETIVP